MPVADAAVAVENVEPPPVEMQSQTTETTRKTMDGYRVQIMASGNEDAAQSVKSAVSTRLGVPAYVEYVDSVYKVRVGDCPTREAAEALRDRCRKAGYGDAWIVSGKILMPARTDGH
jgi:cell division septation protein DedD